VIGGACSQPSGGGGSNTNSPTTGSGKFSITIKNVSNTNMIDDIDTAVRTITHVQISDMEDRPDNIVVVFDEDVSIAPGGQATFAVTLKETTDRSPSTSFGVLVTADPPITQILYGGYYVHLGCPRKDWPVILELKYDGALDNVDD
jgi:hypothetical protein